VKKDYQILIILVRIFLTLAIKLLFNFLAHPMSASELPGKIKTHKIGVEMNKKTSKHPRRYRL